MIRKDVLEVRDLETTFFSEMERLAVDRISFSFMKGKF